MRIAVAQIKPVTGNIQENILRHLRFVKRAAGHQAAMIIFPELSLTGYEPTLAKSLAIHPDDVRLKEFKKIAKENSITIGVGIPLIHENGITISMVLFYPDKAPEIYSKQYLHKDELAYFIPGIITYKSHSQPRISFAICYELSVPKHAFRASQEGAEIYIASVAKSRGGIDKARISLAEIALRYNMTVLMSNCIGLADGEECTGMSSAWNSSGREIGVLKEDREEILILNTENNNVQTLY